MLQGKAVAFRRQSFTSWKAETHYYLPLSDYDRKLARESDHEMMARYSYRIKVG